MIPSAANEDIYIDPQTQRRNTYELQEYSFLVKNNKVLSQKLGLPVFEFENNDIVVSPINETKRSATSLVSILKEVLPLLPSTREDLCKEIQAPKRRIAAALEPLIEMQLLIEVGNLRINDGFLERQNETNCIIKVNPIMIRITENYDEMIKYYNYVSSLQRNHGVIDKNKIAEEYIEEIIKDIDEREK